MPPQVKLNDVIEAFESAGEEHSHYVDKRTGEIVLITNEEMAAAEEDELISEFPEWQRESILKAREILRSKAFVALPDQFDIHEYKIMEDFCLEIQDRNVGETLLGLIKGSGAFRRFKNAIHSMGVEKAWYQFRRTEFEKLAIQWLEQEGLAYGREDAKRDLREIHVTSSRPGIFHFRLVLKRGVAHRPETSTFQWSGFWRRVTKPIPVCDPSRS